MGIRNKKAQSAMEYLMTYGWAILIIAIVLAALFSLGIFSSSSFTGTTCVASSGFICASPVWTSGVLHVTLGQSTGTSWGDVTFFVVPAGARTPTNPTQVGNALAANAYIGGTSSTIAQGTGSMSSGQTAAYTFTLSNNATVFPTAVGSSASGTMWVEYTTPSVTTPLLSQVATMTLKES